MGIKPLSTEGSSAMYIYLKNNDALKRCIKWEGTQSIPYLGSHMVKDYGAFPYVDVSHDVDVVKANEDFGEFFFKATEITFPDYTKTSHEHHRQYGIYHFGKATAELQPGSNSRYWLKIEVDSWEDLIDLKIIQEKIAAGLISPSISYERGQRVVRPLEILRQILRSRKLTQLQRFFLALRLTRA